MFLSILTVFKDAESFLKSIDNITHQPHLIIVDMHLPKMQGLDILPKIRNHGTLSQVPVVFYSLKCTDQELEFIEGGGSTFIPKPYNYEDLHSVVKEIIKKARIN